MASKTRKKNVLRTQLCDMLGIEYPIVLAGMGTAAGPTIAAAVSNAGGLGVLAAIDLDAEELHRWIKKTKTLTDKPFGVDTVFVKTLPQNKSLDEIRGQLPDDAVQFVEKMRQNIDVPEVRGRPHTYVSSRRIIEEQFEVCVEEKIPVLVSALGNPDWIMPRARAHGMKVMGLVGNVKEARDLARSGVDIIIAQGTEAGGHTGRIGTMALVPQVVDAVAPIPVMAAGGIADGRGLVAALALGAIGVWCGTAFVATYEASVDHVEAGFYAQWEIDLWKKMIVNATEEDARITRVLTGKTFRHVANRFTQEWEKGKGPALKEWPYQGVLLADIQAGIRQAQSDDYFFWTPAGQIAGMIKQLKTAQQVVDDMVAGASEILGGRFRREVITRAPAKARRS